MIKQQIAINNAAINKERSFTLPLSSAVTADNSAISAEDTQEIALIGSLKMFQNRFHHSCLRRHHPHHHHRLRRYHRRPLHQQGSASREWDHAAAGRRLVGEADCTNLADPYAGVGIQLVHSFAKCHSSRHHPNLCSR